MALELVREGPFSEEVSEIFRDLVRRRVEGNDELRHILTAGYTLGVKRAGLLGREPFPLDVEYALSLLCHWPLKPRGNQQAIDATRRMGLKAARDAAGGDTEPLEVLVPDVALLLPHETLYALQARGFVGHLGREFAH